MKNYEVTLSSVITEKVEADNIELVAANMHQWLKTEEGSKYKLLSIEEVTQEG